MPNAKVLSEKQAIVAALTEKIQNSGAGVIVDYKGITVAEDTTLRAECRKNDVEYSVIKNTLLRFAFNNCGLNELDEQLNGTTSLAIAADPVAPARVIAEFAKKLNGRFEIKGGFLEGKVVPMETVNALAYSAVQHDDLDGPLDAEHPAFLRPVRTRGHRRTHPR